MKSSQLLVFGFSLFTSVPGELLLCLLSFDVLSVKGWSDRESLDLELILINQDASKN